MSSLIVKVCKVDNIIKHPNADKLSIVQVLGWNCIVGLDQYKIGDLVVFVPPDCVLPENLVEQYKLEYLKKNGRTGTVKLRGVISQGLILDLPEGRWDVGDDVAGVLGITKWSPPEASYFVGVAKTSKKKINPLFDRYTEIENIKHYQDVFSEEDFVCITEKIHGSNFRAAALPLSLNPNVSWIEKLAFFIKKYIFKKEYEFVYGSHNVQITEHSNRNSFYGDDVWGKIAKKYDLVNKIPENTILYGEIYGKGIQDLEYGLDDIRLVVFDIKQNGKYLDYPDVVAFCSKKHLPIVPELYVGKYYDGILDEFTSGKSMLCPKQIREGVVLKTVIEENNLKIGRKILKSISTDYLIRKNGTEYT